MPTMVKWCWIEICSLEILFSLKLSKIAKELNILKDAITNRLAVVYISLPMENPRNWLGRLEYGL